MMQLSENRKQTADEPEKYVNQEKDDTEDDGGDVDISRVTGTLLQSSCWTTAVVGGTAKRNLSWKKILCQ